MEFGELLEKQREIREDIIKAVREELMGPRSMDETLEEKPNSAYIVGILHPESEQENAKKQENEIANESIIKNKLVETSEEDENLDVDALFEDDTADDKNILDDDKKDEDNFRVLGNIKINQSSMGFNCYIDKTLKELKVEAQWGKYKKDKIKRTKKDKDGNEKEESVDIYKREQETIKLSLNIEKSYNKSEISSGVWIEYTRKDLIGTNFSIISVFLINRKGKEEGTDWEALLYQARLKAEGIFYREFDAKPTNNKRNEDFLFESKPVFGRGYGCAIIWKNKGSFATEIETSFMPAFEMPSVSPELEGLEFSIKKFASSPNKPDYTILDDLQKLPDLYKGWIDDIQNNSSTSEAIKCKITENCSETLNRIQEGIDLLKENKRAFRAFIFMNQCLFEQNIMKIYTNKRKTDLLVKFDDIKNSEVGLNWRPFQIAFVLLNLKGIVHPESKDREIVDLLWFPTGGGKTEAYLGIIAFTIAYRRLIRKKESDYERDGGVTVILRYTLRLLTTQQRDRLLRVIAAAEKIREEHVKKTPENPLFGYSRFTVGFWVGKSTTPNKFKEFEDMNNKSLDNCLKQIITCPYCGEPITKDNIKDHNPKKSLEIFCSNGDCFYNKYSIPVSIIDEEIYSYAPTVIMSTVDKFASLPWETEIGSLFGLSEGYDRDGRLWTAGQERKLKKTKKPYLPPELIIQDELHLITGPLGTIYGGYESAIEKLCSYKLNDKLIKPKYVVSTATITNAQEQIKKLYARENYLQFPPSGIKAEDSFFSKEIPIEERPFRKYVGIAAPGQSMKTALARIYAILLQVVLKYSEEELKNIVDPYTTLIGYFNSVRELGGAVMLLKDDIDDRIKVITKRDNYESKRYYRSEELTSRISSTKIPAILELLQNSYNDERANFIDVAVATNMISVGMDVDRLGLMVVTGQPKTTAEYIQTTSRVGRKYPGLVFTLYNPYRPRDLSHYEDFIPYHSSIYRYVEGTTATPFSARARDRVLKASIISLVRLGDSLLAPNKGANEINSIPQKINDIRESLEKRVRIIQPENLKETLGEFDGFIDQWKEEIITKTLYYNWPDAKTQTLVKSICETLMIDYSKKEKGLFPILRSMRDVAQSVHVNYYFEGDENDEE